MSLRNVLTVFLIITLLTSIGFIYFAINAINSADESEQLFKTSKKIEYEAQSILRHTFEMEAAMRGYLLTKNIDVFRHYDSASQKVKEHWKICDQLTRDSEFHQEHLDRLAHLLGKRKSLLGDVQFTNIKMSENKEKIAGLIEEGDDIADEIRTIVEEMLAYERKELYAKESYIDENIADSKSLIFIFGFLTILVSIAGYYLIVRENRDKEKLDKEKKQIMLELKENEERLSNLINTSSDTIAIVNNQGNVVMWSEGGEIIFGYKSEELLGEPIDVILVDEFKGKTGDNSELFTHIPDIYKKGSNSIQIKGQHKSSKKFPIEILYSQWKAKGEKFYGLAIRDISQRISDQEKLKSLVEELERSNNDLQQFAYVASHDLQEPLRKIQAFGDRLMTTYNKDPEKSLQYLERMQNGAQRMQKLIQDLLAFSRVSRNTGHQEKVDINEVLEQVISDLQISIEENNASIKVGDLPVLKKANPIQMHQLFLNLLSNAIKFRLEKVDPYITVSSEKKKGSQIEHDLLNQKIDGRKYYYEIIVEDNGIGFDDKYLDRIFTIFQRLHGRSEYQGTGIGLAVCKKICENHNGFITAEGKKDKGAKFILILPV